MGEAEGDALGFSVGAAEGLADGPWLGFAVGDALGFSVGAADGLADGCELGLWLGAAVGAALLDAAVGAALLGDVLGAVVGAGVDEYAMRRATTKIVKTITPAPNHARTRTRLRSRRWTCCGGGPVTYNLRVPLTSDVLTDNPSYGSIIFLGMIDLSFYKGIVRERAHTRVLLHNVGICKEKQKSTATMPSLLIQSNGACICCNQSATVIQRAWRRYWTSCEVDGTPGTHT